MNLNTWTISDLKKGIATAEERIKDAKATLGRITPKQAQNPRPEQLKAWGDAVRVIRVGYKEIQQALREINRRQVLLFLDKQEALEAERIQTETLGSLTPFADGLARLMGDAVGRFLDTLAELAGLLVEVMRDCQNNPPSVQQRFDEVVAKIQAMKEQEHTAKSGGGVGSKTKPQGEKR